MELGAAPAASPFPPCPRSVGGGVLCPLEGSWPLAEPDPRWGAGLGRPGMPEFVTRVVPGVHGSFAILPQEDVCQGGLSASETRAATRVCVCGLVCARVWCAPRQRKEGAASTSSAAGLRAGCGPGPGSRGSPAPQRRPRCAPEPLWRRPPPHPPPALRPELLALAGDGAPRPSRVGLYTS